MSSDIETTALAELCEQVIDCPHSTPVWMDAGVIVLRSSNIKNGRLDLSNPSYTDEYHYQERSKRAEVQAGDLVITREAPMGEVCLIPDDLKCCLGQRMVMLRPDHERCDGKYLLYALQSNRVQNEIRSHEGTGSTVSNLRIPVLKSLPIPTPDLANQKAIAHILGTLDDKIELNRKTNETLEAMAKALFKSWFVDFDPVREKAEGRPTGLPAEISDLFPDSFEDSELGEIPSGWKCSPLADRAIYLSRGISPAYCEEGGVLVLNQKCVRDSRISFEKSRRHDTTRKQIIGREVRRFDALVNSTGVGTLGRVAMMPICQEEVVVDSHITVVRGGNEQESFFISSTLLNRQTEIEALGEGSTGQTELSRVVLGSVPIIFPSPQLIFAYFDFAFIIQDKIEKNDQASVALASARDALLPKLISGEIRIPDAEKMLEEVGV
jgi:type I restriction enzyme, S subunit